MSNFRIGDKVTNDKGWHGTIVARPAKWQWHVKGNLPVVYVHWRERELKMKNRKSSDRESMLIDDPVLSAQPDKLIRGWPIDS